MPIINVKDLGKVKIAGETPTEEERQNMLREIERRRAEAQQAPAITTEEAIAGAKLGESAVEAVLGDTVKGFESLEAPVGREFFGDYEHPLQSEFVRPLTAGVSALPRGVLKGALAASEVVAGRPFAPELIELEQSWSDWERGLTSSAKPEDDDIYAVIGKASEGEVTPLLSLMGRGMVQATPGMIAAIQSMPAYMGTLIGDYAQRAADDRGSESIEFNDLGRAVAMAAAVAGIEKASALKALSGAGATTAPGAALRGSIIEGGEEYAQQHLENIGIQAGSDRPGFLGVDWAEGHKGGIHGLAVGAPMGGIMGGGAAMRRNDTIGRLGRRIADVPARREARLRQEVADLEAEAAQPPVRQDEPAPGMVVEPFVEEISPAAEVVAIEGVLDEDGEIDEVTAKALDKIARDRGLGITRDRDHATVARDAGGDVVGGTYTSFDGDNYTFDVVVSEGAEGKGIASRLLDDAVQGFYEYQDINPDATMLLDVISPVMRRALERRGFKVTEVVGNDGRVIMEPADYDSIGGAVAAAISERLSNGPTPTAEVATEEAVLVEDVEPSRDEPVVEAIIEEATTPTNTVPGYYDQVAPPPLPIEAIDEKVQAVEVQMEKDRLADMAKEARKAAEEAAKEREVAPRPSGAKIRAVTDKGTKRRRIEEIETPIEPMSAKDAIRRLALIAQETTSTEADVTDAVNDAAAAEIRERADVKSPRNADNIEDIKQLAREMGRTDEEIDQLLSHQRMSFADVIVAMDDAGLRTVLAPDGISANVPSATQTLITEVNEGRLSPTNVEIAAIHSTYRTAVSARDNILAAIEQATDPKEIAKLAAADAKLRVLALDALLAQKRGGTPAARALRFRQYLIDPLMNVVEAQARATLKKRKPLTEEEITKINELWDAAEKAEAQAVESEAKAQKALKSAARRLKNAEKALRASKEVKKEAKKKTRKPKKKDEAEKKKSPRQEAAEEEAKPIRVTPVKKSERQKRLEKEFRAAQKAAGKAGDKVQKARAKARKAQRAKGEVPEAAIRRVKIPGIKEPVDLLGAYRKAFGGALVLNSSGDDSALGRQALGLAIQMPSTALKTIPMAVKAAPWTPGHREYALKMQEEMLSSPNQGIRDYAVLEMTEVEGVSNMDDSKDPYKAQEEAWMFRAFETGFLADVLVQPSQNIFGLTLNKLRTEAFDEGARLVAELHGTDLETMRNANLRGAPEGSKERKFANDVKALGMLINVSTGRGTFDAKALGVARHLMFAPRYTMSRLELPYRALQLASGTGKFADVSPEAQALFRRRVGRQMSWALGMMVMSGIAAAANGDDVVEAVDRMFDPESGDFMKMRLGDYHVDTMQGLGATWRYLWPFVVKPAGALEGVLKGELGGTMGWREKPISADRYGQLASNKLAPLLSALKQAGLGYDWRGREITELPRQERTSYQVLDRLPRDVSEKYGMSAMEPGSQEEAIMAWVMDRAIFPAMGLVTPITVQQMASGWAESATKEQKTLAQKAIPLALNFFGISTSHYKDRGKKIPGMPAPPKMPKIRKPVSRWD